MAGALEEATGAMVVVDPPDGEEEDPMVVVGIGREVGHLEVVDPTGAAVEKAMEEVEVDMEEVEVDMEEAVATLDGVKRNL